MEVDDLIFYLEMGRGATMSGRDGSSAMRTALLMQEFLMKHIER
jgi:hypothetical protein